MSHWFRFPTFMLFAIVLGCCCPEPFMRGPCTVVTLEAKGLPAVAVLEKSVRSDDIALPLAGAQKEALFVYLEAGGNRDIIGEDVVIPDARKRYESLLAALSNPENLDPEDLETPIYSSWFKTKPLTQVMDAREERPAKPDSVRAVTDGRFWWVFRRTGTARFSRLVVFKSLGDAR